MVVDLIDALLADRLGELRAQGDIRSLRGLPGHHAVVHEASTDGSLVLGEPVDSIADRGAFAGRFIEGACPRFELHILRDSRVGVRL